MPAANEPHYLAKARHLWQPDWCRGDFFLESADAHAVFFYALGWLPRFISFEASAWTGRCLALALLGTGWTFCISRIAAGSGAAVRAAACFLALASLGNLAGEWIIGGVEAKVFSYAGLLWSLGLGLDRRSVVAAACAGLAVSFHPVVGAWGVLSAVCAAGGLWARCLCRPELLPYLRQPARTWLWAGSAFLACSLPGLLPAVEMLRHADPAAQFRADYIQVAYRLKHHLDPLAFSGWAAAGYAGLVVGWLFLRRKLAASPEERFFAAIVGTSITVAVTGLALAIGPRPIENMPQYAWRIRLLKFYPFRLADVLVPMAAAVAAARVAAGGSRRERAGAADAAGFPPGWGRRVEGCVLAGVFLFALAWPGPERRADRFPQQLRADWIAACRWIRQQTPPDALCLCPEGSWAFKWYAQRPEYVAYKDCPQDAAGVVEWNRRLRVVRRWAAAHFQSGRSAAALEALHAETGVEYLVVRRLGPIAADPVYRNDSFRVYRTTSTPTDARRSVNAPLQGAAVPCPPQRKSRMPPVVVAEHRAGSQPGLRVAMDEMSRLNASVSLRRSKEQR